MLLSFQKKVFLFTRTCILLINMHWQSWQKVVYRVSQKKRTFCSAYEKFRWLQVVILYFCVRMSPWGNGTSFVKIGSLGCLLWMFSHTHPQYPNIYLKWKRKNARMRHNVDIMSHKYLINIKDKVWFCCILQLDFLLDPLPHPHSPSPNYN